MGQIGQPSTGHWRPPLFLIPRIGKKRVSEHPYLRFEGHFGRRPQNIHTYTIVPGDRDSRSRLASRGARKMVGTAYLVNVGPFKRPDGGCCKAITPNKAVSFA